MLLYYEAQTPLRVSMSKGPTRVDIRHLYNTCTTRVRNVIEVFLKNRFFFFVSTLLKSMSDTRMTLIQHVSNNSDKFFSKKWFLTIPYTSFEYVSKQYYQRKIKDNNFDYIIFNSFNYK